jgi:hypothetical protein
VRTQKKKVLIISHDKIGERMAGPGIRYHYMAEVLSIKFDVTVGFFDISYLPEENFPKSYSVKHIDAHYFESGFRGFEIVIAHWLSETMLDFCNRNKIFVVIDLYVPGPVENLAASIYNKKNIKPEDDYSYDKALKMYKLFFENADLFLFSNRRQLDFWTGYAFGADQIHLSTYLKRPLYDRFIYAPMGIDTKMVLSRKRNLIKGVVNNISEKDKLLIWTGGIWGHFDGQVLIKAMARLARKRNDVKLLFLGTVHPNPSIKESLESQTTRRLTQKLGLLNRVIFFNEGWVKYSERINYLLEADAAVNTHKASIETEFSHRTRVLDHFLAELPTIATEGDFLSDEVIQPNGLGIVVKPNDPVALEQAIIEILVDKNNKEIRQRIRQYRKNFDWEITMAQLIKFLESNSVKLERLTSSQSLKTYSKTVRLVKKILPPIIKKAIIRIIRYK